MNAVCRHGRDASLCELCIEEFRAKLKSLAMPRRSGQPETRVERVDGRITAKTTEHWDGRQDATVFPDVVRYGARVHKTGAKAGAVAEVRTMDRKERVERYGERG